MNILSLGCILLFLHIVLEISFDVYRINALLFLMKLQKSENSPIRSNPRQHTVPSRRRFCSRVTISSDANQSHPNHFSPQLGVIFRLRLLFLIEITRIRQQGQGISRILTRARFIELFAGAGKRRNQPGTAGDSREGFGV